MRSGAFTLGGEIQALKFKLTTSFCRLLIDCLLLGLLALIYTCAIYLGGSDSLQQTGEHNENIQLSFLTEYAFSHGVYVPRWNPFFTGGIPHIGDTLTYFFNPLATIPIWLFGAIRGLQISVTLLFLCAGLAQLYFGAVIGLSRTARLWGAAMFMLCGGLAMLWRLGWYTLLVGAVFIPLCLGSSIAVLRSSARKVILIGAFGYAIVFLSGSMYWSLYLGGCLFCLCLLALVAAICGANFAQPLKHVLVGFSLQALIAAALSCVSLLPIVLAIPYLKKEAFVDLYQRGSQPITYSILNYLVADFHWFNTALLENDPGYTWYYIGMTPFLLLLATALALKRPQMRMPIAACAALVVFCLGWAANRHSPFGYLYEYIPTLFYLRFPGRLLLVATSPLIALAAIGVHEIELHIRQSCLGSKRMLLTTALTVVLAWGIFDLYKQNSKFGFVSQNISPVAQELMRDLRTSDPSLYYIDLNSGSPLWPFTAAAMQHQHLMLNIKYGRIPKREQALPAAAIVARALYFIGPNAPTQAATLVNRSGQIGVYKMADVLPFSFSIEQSKLLAGTEIKSSEVSALRAQLIGSDRFLVRASAEQPQTQLLLILQNYFPGWHVSIDAESAELLNQDGYLAVRMRPGEHSYEFTFVPPGFLIGTIVSLTTLLEMLFYLARRFLAQNRT